MNEINELGRKTYQEIGIHFYWRQQNDDSKKEQIAFAQSYFAIQTRKQELIEERIQLMEHLQAREKLVKTKTELSKNIYEKGVGDKGVANIRSKGDWALFGGHNISDMKRKLGISFSCPLADFLPELPFPPNNWPQKLLTSM